MLRFRRRIFLFVVFLLQFGPSNAQVNVTFELKAIPPVKDTSASYYIAGNFNNWKPNDDKYKLNKAPSGFYQLRGELPAAVYEFKVTRGSWSTVEVGTKGKQVNNRVVKLNKDTTVKIEVLNWADDFQASPPHHTAAVNVKLLDTAFYMPQLQKNRRVWIYLPPSYQSTNKKYPVLYMHDGQNLFDQATSGYGEWGVDEILNEVAARGGRECIVVGVDHGGNSRLSEYNPFDSSYGKGQGKAYTQFLVNTLKPFIDKHYRTKGNLKNTTIAGSSMGGLISLYAISHYPNIFGSAGIFSPAFWIASPLAEDLKIQVPKLKSNRIYFVAGDLESKTMVSDMKRIYDNLNPSGTNNHIKFVQKTDGEHKEWFWSREFLDFYNFIGN